MDRKNWQARLGEEKARGRGEGEIGPIGGTVGREGREEEGGRKSGREIDLYKKRNQYN